MIRRLKRIFFSYFSWLVCAIVISTNINVHSQTYYSRDHNAGLSSYASSWQGQAPVVSNETLYNNVGVVVWGYLIHGTALSTANITFDGTEAKLVVEDTVRIHGGLTMKSGSSIHVKPGGVLIVQMPYYQDADVTFLNEGQAIFLDAWQTVDNPTNTSNSGNIYVAGTYTAVGCSMVVKPYSALKTDNPSLYEFSRNQALKVEECAGLNSGNVSFSETGATVLRWESSTDFFHNQITEITNTSLNQTYKDLTKTTSYRAYYKTSSGESKYSPGSTIFILEEAQGGSISGTTEVCGNINNGFLRLQSYYGQILQWESSIDNFSTIASVVQTNSETFSFSNLSQDTQFRVLVENGDCSQKYSDIFYVKYFNFSRGGNLVLEGEGTVCKGNNSGQLTLSDHFGSVVQWESSTSEDFATITIINSTATQINFSNLTKTTYYRVVVKSGPCSHALSNSVAIEVSEVVAGSLSGDQSICTGVNSTLLTLSGYRGNIIRWESSTDNFANIVALDHTSHELIVPTPTQTTSYRVVVGNGGICPDVISSTFDLIGNPSLNGGTLAKGLAVLPADGLMESFPFSGNAKNATGNGNDGIVIGAIPVFDRFGMADHAYKFNGLDDLITTPFRYPAPGPQVFTISIWFKTFETTGGRLIGYSEEQTGWSNRFDRHIYMDDQGQLFFGIYKHPNHNFVQTPESYNDGQWHHAVATLSSGGIKLYVDGILRVSDPKFTVAEDFSGFWRLGGDSMGTWPESPSHPYFEGELDDVLIYDRELSQEEINKLYGVGVEPLCPGEPLLLRAATVTGASYTWSGPDGFTSNEQNPVISAVSSAHAGTYAVSIDILGCSLSGTTEVSVTPAEGGSVVASESAVCSGTNAGTLSLQNYVGDIIRWEYSTDNFVSDVQVIAQTTTELAFSNLSSTTSYRAVVKNETCGSEQNSTVVTVTVDAPSQGGTLSGSATVCKDNNGTISLSGHTGSVIHWESSVNADFSTITNINSTATEISYSNLSATTYYRAVVKNGGCTEAYSTTAAIEVSEIVGGVLSGAATVCKDNNNGTISLSGHIGNVVRWESAVDAGFSTPTTINSTATSISYSNLNVTTYYRAVVKNEVCSEVYSASAGIEVKEISGGFVSGPTEFCSGNNSGVLTLAGYIGSIIRWESSRDAFNSNIESIAHTGAEYSFSNLGTTTSFRAVIGNEGCASTYSSSATVSLVPSSVGGELLSYAGMLCPGDNSGTLSLENYTGTIVQWELSADGFAGHVEVIPHTKPELSFSDLPETYSYRVVIKSGDCNAAYSTTATLQVENLTAGGVVEGGKRVRAGENEGFVEVKEYEGSILNWERSTDGFLNDVHSIQLTDPVLAYQDIAVKTWFRAVVQKNGCTPVYSVPALITPNNAPIAVADTFEVEAGKVFYGQTSLLENDSDPDNDPLNLAIHHSQLTEAGNSLSFESSGTIVYEPWEGFTGTDRIQYTLCDEAGEASICTYGWVVLLVRPSQVVVYEGLSPNNDQKNDEWCLGNIEFFGDNLVQLYNTNGVLVYEMQGYNNVDKVFTGKGNRGIGSSGKELPDGTYYYRIRLGEAQLELKGYIILNR